MELVSASKLRRAQEQARATRQYREATYELLARLAAIREVEEQPLFKKRPINSRLYIIITSNSGLAGAYNTNVLKLLAQSAINDKANKVKSSVIAIGSKGAQFVRRTSEDRKSTRLNSSHQIISYAVFCLKKKKPKN